MQLLLLMATLQQARKPGKATAPRTPQKWTKPLQSLKLLQLVVKSASVMN